MAIIKKFRIKSFKQQRPLVSLKKISLSFGQRQILDNVSFNINRGEILGMLGPNGVGKSTIFHLITGLIKPDYGSLIFNNINATNYPIYLRTTKFKIGDLLNSEASPVINIGDTVVFNQTESTNNGHPIVILDGSNYRAGGASDATNHELTHNNTSVVLTFN